MPLMTSQNPYIIRAIYDWLIDNDETPQLLVDASKEYVQVPRKHVGKDGRILLNVGPKAVRGLTMGNDFIVFSTRFSGVSEEICIPTHAVIGIYSKENNVGMMFAEVSPKKSSATGQDPTLTVDPEVDLQELERFAKAVVDLAATVEATETGNPVTRPVTRVHTSDAPQDPDPTKRKKRKAQLKVVK